MVEKSQGLLEPTVEHLSKFLNIYSGHEKKKKKTNLGLMILVLVGYVSE